MKAEPRDLGGWGYVLVVVSTLAVTSPSLGVPFVYDDFATIVENRSLDNFRWALTWERFRPLTNLGHYLEKRVWGLDPFGYHLSQWLLHALNAGLLAGVVRTVVGRGVWGWVAALLWSVHPALSAAVAYPSARSEVQGATFVLVGFLAFERWRSGGRRAWLGLTVLALAGGIGSRETAAMLPLLLLVRTVTVEGWRSRTVRWLAALAGVLLVGAGLRVGAYVSQETDWPVRFIPATSWPNPRWRPATWA